MSAQALKRVLLYSYPQTEGYTFKRYSLTYKGNQVIAFLPCHF